ncbi:augmin subunit 2 [Tanacetum coccineum]
MSRTQGNGRIGSKVALQQLVEPAIVPLPPVSWYLRGITTRTVEIKINDLLDEAARNKGVSATESNIHQELSSNERKLDKIADIKERWALRQRKALRTILRKLRLSLVFLHKAESNRYRENILGLKILDKEVKSAIKSATKTKETAKKWLSMMSRDCNRFCKIMLVDKSYEHEDGFVIADICIGADIQFSKYTCADIASWTSLLWILEQLFGIFQEDLLRAVKKLMGLLQLLDFRAYFLLQFFAECHDYGVVPDFLHQGSAIEVYTKYMGFLEDIKWFRAISFWFVFNSRLELQLNHVPCANKVQRRSETSLYTRAFFSLDKPKDLSELLHSAARDYGTLAASISDIHWTRKFQEPPSVWRDMLRPIHVALVSCSRYFEVMSAMRESFTTLQMLRVVPTNSPNKYHSQLPSPTGSNCVTPYSSRNVSLRFQKGENQEGEDETDDNDVDDTNGRRLSWHWEMDNGL